jgi:hypothetical protein
MPTIFSSAGRAAAVVSDIAIPTILTIQDPTWKGFSVQKCVLTSMTLNGQSVVQFKHMLREAIYVYVFGEGMIELTAVGFAFASTCSATSYTGLELAMDWWEQKRISTTGLPITLTLGVIRALSGFLVGFNYQVVDPAAGLGQIAFRFQCPPRLPVQVSNLPYMPPTVPPPSLDNVVIGPSLNRTI